MNGYQPASRFLRSAEIRVDRHDDPRMATGGRSLWRVHVAIDCASEYVATRVCEALQRLTALPAPGVLVTAAAPSPASPTRVSITALVEDPAFGALIADNLVSAYEALADPRAGSEEKDH